MPSSAKPISLLLLIVSMLLTGVLLLGTLWLFWRHYQKRLADQHFAPKRLVSPKESLEEKAEP